MIHLSRTCHRMMLIVVLLSSCLLLLQGRNITLATPICNHTIEVNVSEADGSSNFSSVRAGDTVCIPAGNRGPLTLTNFQGSASEPITFINNGGQVTIMGPPNQQKGDSTAALTIEKSSHIRLTGTGQEQKCGAPYPSSLQQCGIRITGGWWGLMGRENSNMEIDHVEFYQTGGPMSLS